MPEADAIKNQAEVLRALLEESYGMTAPTLESAVRRAGRRLPRTLRRKAAVVVEAEMLSGHPKLAPRVDGAAVQLAVRDITDHLKSYDLAEKRKTRLLNILAGVAFNILIVLVLFLCWLWWQKSV